MGRPGGEMGKSQTDQMRETRYVRDRMCDESYPSNTPLASLLNILFTPFGPDHPGVMCASGDAMVHPTRLSV